jgi:hypothetical protein
MCELVRVVEGSRTAETLVHRKLRRFRVKAGKDKNICEWYSNPEAVLKFFADIPQAKCLDCERPWPKLRKVSRTTNPRSRCGPRASAICLCGRDVPFRPSTTSIVVVEA